MNSAPSGSDVGASARNRATLAFLLGWAVSELLGLVRKGIRVSPAAASASPDYAPRLTASQGSLDAATDALLFSADRVASFYRQLGLEPGETSPLTKELDALPGRNREWLEGKGQPVTAHSLYDLLEPWTLQAWAELNGASKDSARAFTAGLSLADTYWYMRLPARRKNLKASQTGEEGWRRLLSRYRLDIARSRLHTLRDDLPPYVVDVISNHLRAWSIGTEVGYRDNRPVFIPNGKESAPLTEEDEANLQRALARQVQNWEAMLFGLREAPTFLHGRDRLLIAVGRWAGMFLADFGTALFFVLAAVLLALFLGATLVPGLLALFRGSPPGLSDWLSIIGLLWTILLALPVPLVVRAAYQLTRGAQKGLDYWLTAYFVTRRTYIPWDHYMKHGG